MFDSVTKEYVDGENKRIIIDNLSFRASSKKLIAIVGPSGVGKSTFLSMAGGLLTPSSGQIYINDQEISTLSPQELNKVRLESIGFIFQGSHLLPSLTVWEQLSLLSHLSKKQISDHTIRTLLHSVGLESKINEYPENLSGGEAQRVAIARAFVHDPAIILADEPTANLDEEKGREIVQMIKEAVVQRDKLGIIVTHDTRLLSLADEVYQLEKGKLHYD